MSAVEDVAARIRRLEEARAGKHAQLRQLQHELRYNPHTGVDERLDSGHSVARLELKVEGGRNMLFKAGFLSGKMAYVRVTVEVASGGAGDSGAPTPTVMEQKVTTKRPVQYAPHWQEAVVFEGLPAAVGTLRLDVMQEERIGADELIGTCMMPLARLQDQRAMEKWHVLSKHDKATISEILFNCRFHRSPISALELELELLQNQANELHLFLGRHQHLMGLPPPAPLERLASPKPLQGKEVMPGQLAPEQSRSTRFSVVDSFPPNMRKREHGESAVNVEMHEAPHAKRQRVVVTEKQVNSLSDRLANWLMPITTTSTPGAQTDAPTQGDSPLEEAAGTTSRQFFPFKQRQPTPGPRRPRRSGRPHPGVQKTPTALQAIEQWFFTDKDGNPRTMPFGNQAPSY